MKHKTLVIFFITALFMFFGAHAAFAQTQGTFVPLAPIPGLTQDAAPTSAGTAAFLNNLYKYLIGLAAAAAIIEIIWGGIEWSTQDSVSKKGQGRHRIEMAILGLVLVLSPALVFYIINPSILNLSVNFSPLDTPSGPPPGASPGGGTSNTPAQPPMNGCTESGGYLINISCGTDALAQSAAAACGGVGTVTQPAGCGGSYTTDSTGQQVCANPTPAKAVCATHSNEPYIFVNVGDMFAVKATLQHVVNSAGTPLDPNYPNFQSFKSTCTSDGGVMCVDNIGSSIACPAGTTYTGQGLTNMTTSGKCYQARVLCTTSALSDSNCSGGNSSNSVN